MDHRGSPAGGRWLVGPLNPARLSVKRSSCQGSTVQAKRCASGETPFRRDEVADEASHLSRVPRTSRKIGRSIARVDGRDGFGGHGGPHQARVNLDTALGPYVGEDSPKPSSES